MEEDYYCNDICGEINIIKKYYNLSNIKKYSKNNWQTGTLRWPFITFNIVNKVTTASDIDDLNISELKTALKEKRPDIIIVEDNCEGFMGKHNNIYSGTQSLASSISFYGNKHVTCGEGGAFITNDTFIYNKIKSFCRQGNTDKKFIHNLHAFNYRLNNVSAAILFSQLENLDTVISKMVVSILLRTIKRL